ncbi:hypothetical protein [Streptomyces sp. NPDC005408]|uniref:hypothetical protein n=1 Tax=Streptomyces sp. NPDC005408 TaxID=3155341 RepID=UPI0033A186C6
MDLVLDPPHGAGPVRLGMTLGEAVAAVSPWGPHRIVEEFDYFDDEDEDEEDAPEEGEASKTIHTALQEIRVNVLLEGSGEAVTAVELWWPGEGWQTDVRVLLDGEDVFRTPAEDLFRRAAERGWAVDQAEAEYPFVPGVSLGFTRQTSQEVPRTPDGLPVHVTSVLVGGEHYYDNRMKNRA